MNLGNRTSQHNFAMVPSANIPRSKFDRSFPFKDTFDFDYLTPFFIDEILPGDDISLSVNTFARLSTQIRPVMDNMYLDFFFFFCPNRLLQTNWVKLMGEQNNPGDTISYILPTLDAFPAGGPEVGTIYDKMGLPTDVAGGWTLNNTLPLRMYNLVYKEWFRDENLQNSPTINVDDGPDQIADYSLLKRGKRKDYFTGALPFLQKGTAISLPLGTSANVLTSSTRLVTGTQSKILLADTGGNIPAAGTLGIRATTGSGTYNNVDPGLAGEWYPTNLYADLSNATAATINQLRQAIQVQSLLERDARGGTRYIELIASHFKVTVPDFRLQRPEYLGGGSQRINSHPVSQTSPTSGSNAQGQLAGFGTSSGSCGFTKSFVEHGYVMGIMCARADITYQQGKRRMWDKSSRYDFFWPELQGLGEQAILNSEIYMAGSGGTDSDVFGYQERYAEYKYMPGEIRGQFRSTYASTLDVWHLAEKFASVPALNSTFIVQNTPVARIQAVNTEPHLLIDGFVRYIHARPMHAHSVPVSLGKF